jgi:hypothetical protein
MTGTMPPPNSKPESRNPKQTSSPKIAISKKKAKPPKSEAGFGFDVWNLPLVSDFGFRD